MPITQERLRQLLTAGENYQFNYENLKTTIHQQARRAENGEITLAQAMHNVIIQSGGIDLSTSQILLAQERLHYRLTNSKNTTDRKRGGAKRTNRPSAPTSNIQPERPVPMRTAAQVAAEVDAEEEAQSHEDTQGHCEESFGAPSFVQPRSAPVMLSKKEIEGIHLEGENMLRKQWKMFDHYGKYPMDQPADYKPPVGKRPEGM